MREKKFFCYFSVIVFCLCFYNYSFSDAIISHISKKDLFIPSSPKAIIAYQKQGNKNSITTEQFNKYLDVIGDVSFTNSSVLTARTSILNEILYINYFSSEARKAKFDQNNAVKSKINEIFEGRNNTTNEIASKIEDKKSKDIYLNSVKIGDSLLAKKTLAFEYYGYLMRTHSFHQTQNLLKNSTNTKSANSLGTSISESNAKNYQIKSKIIFSNFEKWKKEFITNLDKV